MNCNELIKPYLKPNATLDEFKAYQNEYINYLRRLTECEQNIEWKDTDANRYARTTSHEQAKQTNKMNIYYILVALAIILLLFIKK